MRAHEIMNENVSPAAEVMMMKMRKGGAAALNAKLLAEIISHLQGWKIENTKVLKPSDGGWVLSGTPFGDMVKKMYGNHGGKTYHSNHIQYHAEFDPSGGRDAEWNERSKLAYVQMKDQVVPLIQANMSKKGRYEIQNLEVKEGMRGNYQRIEIEFDFFVWCSAYIVTSSDGGTYEICGDYKNGAVNPTDFQTFFKWASTETDFMDQILGLLGLEAIEKKQDLKKPYTPSPGSSEQTMKVYGLLKEMTMDVRASQKTHLIEYMTDTVGRFQETLKTDVEAAKKMASRDPLIAMLWDREKKQISANWQAKLEPIAEEQVEAMQNEFVYKNTGKLSPILTRKGGDFKCDVVGISTRHGTIEATLKFSFGDGSEFTVTQRIEQSYVMTFRMSQPTYFYRYPTRFTNVRLPDGTKMYPSEENMNEIFAKA